MIFKTEKEAVEWLEKAGLDFNISSSRKMITWQFILPETVYKSKPFPKARTDWEGESDKARQNRKERESIEDAERLKKHKPKTFLEAVNLLAERFGLKPTEC